MVIGWAKNVNKRILDSTSIQIGEGGYVEDKGENNSVVSERRLTSLFSPDKFEVQMDFDWLEKDENGMSEFDRFISWYKYVHKRGVNPFWFPSITKFDTQGPISKRNPITGELSPLCQYKITSGIKPVKSGFSMRCSMTWVEVYCGPGIIIAQPENFPDRIVVENGKVSCFFLSQIQDISVDDFKLEYKGIADDEFSQLDIINYTTEKNRIDLFYSNLLEGSYFVKLTYKDIVLTEAIGVN